MRHEVDSDKGGNVWFMFISTGLYLLGLIVVVDGWRSKVSGCSWARIERGEVDGRKKEMGGIRKGKEAI